MARFFTTRRKKWAAGVGILGSGIGIGAVLGVSLGLRYWAFYLGVVLGALAVVALRRLRRRGLRTSGPEDDTEPLTPAPGGKDYDLEKDDSTDGQRWVM